MATIVYLLIYLIMFVAAIRLRYAQPDKERPFRTPGGMVGMWLVGGVGIAGALTAVSFSFIPPTQVSTGNPVTPKHPLLTVAGRGVSRDYRVAWQGRAGC